MTAAEREAEIVRLMPMCRNLAYRMSRRVRGIMSFEDLLFAAYEAAIYAVDRFDPTYGMSLRRYAFATIRGKLLNAVRAWDILPERYRRVLREGPAVHDSALYTRAVIADREVGEMLSLDARLPEGERPRSDWSNDPCAIICKSELREILETLRPRERYAIERHYYDGCQFSEIGEELGLSRQRISQIHLVALKKLRRRYGAAA